MFECIYYSGSVRTFRGLWNILQKNSMETCNKILRAFYFSRASELYGWLTTMIYHLFVPTLQLHVVKKKRLLSCRASILFVIHCVICEVKTTVHSICRRVVAMFTIFSQNRIKFFYPSRHFKVKFRVYPSCIMFARKYSRKKSTLDSPKE